LNISQPKLRGEKLDDDDDNDDNNNNNNNNNNNKLFCKAMQGGRGLMNSGNNLFGMLLKAME